MANVPLCPICGAADVSVYLDGRDQTPIPPIVGRPRCDFSHGGILRCDRCKFGFRQARFNEEELSALYRKMDASVYDSELRGRARTAARHLSIVHGWIQGGWMLDIGCASGLFLERAAGAGWSVVGVEPSEALCAGAKAALNGRGEVICTTLENASLRHGSFDAVTLWDVLEHVPRPVAFLRRSGQLLKPGGHLFLNVPDLDSRPARWLGGRWPLLLPEHLNYFNRANLERCVAKAGLEVVRFGRRCAYFSVGYVLYRLAQHRIPCVPLAQKVAGLGFSKLTVPVSLGETYAVCRR
jgi:SAM-dependent methyltransferase